MSPLASGQGKKVFSSNVGELLGSYKEKGTIGNTTPKSKKKARQIALAIAYNKQKGG